MLPVSEIDLPLALAAGVVAAGLGVVLELLLQAAASSVSGTRAAASAS